MPAVWVEGSEERFPALQVVYKVGLIGLYGWRKGGPC